MMKRGRKETSPRPIRLGHGVDIHISFDLMVEIFIKLPAKSLVRFQCLSKLWSSVISSCRDFTDSIVARSLTQPPRHAHLIFPQVSPLNNNFECLLAFSFGTCPRITDKVSVHDIPGDSRQYVRGLLLCVSYMTNETAIYNPTTRQCFPLPKRQSLGLYFLGYDPLMNQYKVLLQPVFYMENASQVTQVFTLGDPREKQWRTIQGDGSHFPVFDAVCINGAIYYQAFTNGDDSTSRYRLMRFDVRSEEFNHIDAPKTRMDAFSNLINYQGELGFVCCLTGLEIWVREDGDLKTQKWSKIFSYEMEGLKYWPITGATRDGEIVFSNRGSLKAFYVPYIMIQSKTV